MAKRSDSNTTDAGESDAVANIDFDVSAFPAQLQAIGASVAAVLGQLDAVTASKRMTILELAAVGGSSQTEAEAARTRDDATAKAKQELRELAEAHEGDESVPGAMLAQVAAHAVGLAFENVVATSQQLDALAQAVLARAAANLLDGEDGGPA